MITLSEGLSEGTFVAEHQTTSQTLTEAMRFMKKDEVVQKAGELPEGKFRVFYADPPWQDGNSGFAFAVPIRMLRVPMVSNVHDRYHHHNNRHEDDR